MITKKTVQKPENCCDCTPKAQPNCGSTGSAVYGIGLVGAVVYFFQNAATFNDYVMGILKAFVWPALLVYKALETLKY